MLILYLVFSVCIISAYCYLIIYILFYWNNIQVLDKAKEQQLNKPIGISIIIPARNEAKNIIHCIHSILENNKIDILRPQIIVIDDHSTDDTAELVRSLGHEYVDVISLNDSDNLASEINAYKKAAITLGLAHSKFDFVIQLDADTIVPKNYLSTITQYQNHYDAQFLAAPIKFYPCNNLLHHFQQLDILGMMAVTGAGIKSNRWHMANGANMCYIKDNIQYNLTDAASGDDVYTIQKIAKTNLQDIHYIKDVQAIVTTSPVDTYAALYNQRIRWATKNKTMTQKSMQIMMGIPFINALLILFHIPMIFLYGVPVMMFFLFHIILKLMIDYVYLKEMTDHFGAQESMKYFLPANMMHILYVSVIGVLSFFIKKYNWKGRSVH